MILESLDRPRCNRNSTSHVIWGNVYSANGAGWLMVLLLLPKVLKTVFVTEINYIKYKYSMKQVFVEALKWQAKIKNKGKRKKFKNAITLK